MSEDPKKVSNNDLKSSQFGGGIIDAGTVNANQIGNTVEQRINNINVDVRFQIQTILMPILENSEKLPATQSTDILSYINGLIKDASSLKEFNTKNSILAQASEYKIENISQVETIYAHCMLASYLEPIRVRCNLVLSSATATLKAIDINDFYEEEDVYEAIKGFCDFLFVCLDWLYQSLKWFYAFPLPNSSKNDLSTCPKKLLEYAFDILKNEAKNWTDAAEAATEVNVYLNLLFQQIYS